MLQTGVAEFPEAPAELAVRRKDGSEIIGEFHPAMLRTEEGIFFYVTVRDVTDQKGFAIIDNLNEPPTGPDPDPDKSFEKIVRAAGTVLHADFAVYQKMSGDFLNCAAGWNAPSDFMAMRKKEGTICYDIIKMDKPRPTVIQNLDKTDFAETDPTIMRNGLKTVIGFPVRDEKKAIGALCVYYKNDKETDANGLQNLWVLSQALGDREAFIMTGEMLKQNRRGVVSMVINVGQP